MPEKKANHRVNVVRLGEPRVHTNADALELFDIGGYQVVTRKGQFKAGDLAVYIQPDSVVPQTEAFRFIWEPYSTPEVNNAGDTFNPAVGPRRRRITVRKFRKEWSEGLLMPLKDFSEPHGVPTHWREGEDVSDILGITHWEGDEVESTTGQADSRPRRSRPRTLKGWFYFILFKLGVKGARKQMIEELAYDIPKFDVEALKNYKYALKPGEEVVVTEKIHGSQGRFFFRDGKMFAGSRNFWKAPDVTVRLAQGSPGQPVDRRVVPSVRRLHALRRSHADPEGVSLRRGRQSQFLRLQHPRSEERVPAQERSAVRGQIVGFKHRASALRWPVRLR
jgi:hypothetical protein